MFYLKARFLKNVIYLYINKTSTLNEEYYSYIKNKIEKHIHYMLIPHFVRVSSVAVTRNVIVMKKVLI